MAKRIAVDIGNSTIACGLFDGQILVSKWYHPLKETQEAAAALFSKHQSESVKTVAVSSVVRWAKDDVINKLAERNVPTLEVSLEKQKAISNTYPTLGHDRLANATAVLKHYMKDTADAGIAIDFGTATTLTAVSKTGRLVGGMITLGLKETIKAIYSNTDQLPLLAIDTVFQKNSIEPLATTTDEAILNGTVLGHIAMVESWIADARRQLNGNTITIATGGLAQFFSCALEGSIDRFDADLTLKGINLIAEGAEDREDPG